MKTSILLALGAVTLFAAGCATQTTHNGTNTYFLDGLVTVKRGSFEEPPPTTNPSDTTKWYGDGSASGNSVSILDDAFEFNNY